MLNIFIYYRFYIRFYNILSLCDCEWAHTLYFPGVLSVATTTAMTIAHTHTKRILSDRVIFIFVCFNVHGMYMRLHSPLTLFCYSNLNVIHIVSENWSFDCACCARVLFWVLFCVIILEFKFTWVVMNFFCKRCSCFALLLLRLSVQLGSDAINCLFHLHFQCANLIKKNLFRLFLRVERAFFHCFISRINFSMALRTKSFTRLLLLWH